MNNYGMNGYANNYGNYGQPFFPSQYQPAAQQQQQMQSAPINTNKIYVGGINDVNTRPLPPNSEYIFLDNDKALLYQKKVDSNGHFQVKTFDIIEHKEDDAVPVQEFASKSDFESLQSRISSMESKLSNLASKKDEGGKGNGTETSHGNGNSNGSSTRNGSI